MKKCEAILVKLFKSLLRSCPFKVSEPSIEKNAGGCISFDYSSYPAWEWDHFPNTFMGRQEVHFVNKGLGDVYNVTATVTCVPINVVATDPDVTLGDIPAGSSAWSTDTYELRVVLER